MKLAIIGDILSGKSTLFAALTGIHGSKAKGYFSQIGTFTSKDKRVYTLASLLNARKITPINYEVGDFDGFGKLYKEEKAGEIVQELSAYDLFINVVGAYKNKDIEDEFEDMLMRLIFSDLRFVEKRISRLEKEVKAKKASEKELILLRRIEDTLLSERPISSIELNIQEKQVLSGYQFLTIKPIIVIINTSEDQINYEASHKIPGVYPIISTSLIIEKELAELAEEDRAELLKEYGLKDSAVHRLEEIILKELGYIIFYTAGEKETRAWLLKKGLSVWHAAGKIHSDIQRGFIRAEVIHYPDFIEATGHKEAKNLNLMHLEGKDYIVQDGDVINIRFSI